MSEPKTYYGSCNASTGSSGFTNFFGRKTPEQMAKLHAQMIAELPEHVIINGKDDFTEKPQNRPEHFYYTFANERNTGRDDLLAFYHTGVSGITHSGIVVTPECFDAMTEWYKNTFGHEMMDNQNLRIVFHSNSTAL